MRQALSLALRIQSLINDTGQPGGADSYRVWQVLEQRCAWVQRSILGQGVVAGAGRESLHKGGHWVSKKYSVWWWSVGKEQYRQR